MKKTLLFCALALLITAPAHAADSSLDLARRAVALEQTGQYQEAEALFEKALAQKDMDNAARAKTYYNLGTVALRLGKSRRAEKSFSESLALEPKNADALINRSEALRLSGQITKAMQDVDAALRLDASKHAAQYQKGLILLSLDKSKDAEGAFMKALAGDPKNQEYKMGLARALLNERSYKKAVDTLTEVIKANPWKAHAYLFRSVGWSGLKKFELSRADLTLAARLAPNDGAVRSIYKRARFPAAKRDSRLVTVRTESRAAPEEKAHVVQSFEKGYEVDVLSCDSGSWCRIEADGHFVGYLPQSKMAKKK